MSGSHGKKRSRDNNTGQDPKICLLLKSSWDGVSTPCYVRRRSTLMSKLIDAYVSRKQLSDRSLRFIYSGDRLQKKKTAEMHGMVDGDEILVVSESSGGSGSGNGSGGGSKISI